MDLKPIADFFAHFSWSEIVSGLIGAGVVAVLNLWIGHWLATKRDKANREGNAQIQREAENRQYGTLEDQRKDLEHSAMERDRTEAVRAYYANYIAAYTNDETGPEKVKSVIVATRLFRMESAVHDPEMPKQIDKFLKLVAIRVEKAKVDPAGLWNAYNETVSYLINFQETMFDQLLLWGFHGKPRKFGELMDRELAELQG